MGKGLDECEKLRSRIKEVLNEEAPVNVLKGTTIAAGYSEELDEFRGLATSGKDYLDKMLARETERTGITSLKIASNNVFGYYIEVRNTHKDKVPEEWIRKQTLVNAERYITEELKEYEAKILGAEERILELEQQLFAQLDPLDAGIHFTGTGECSGHCGPGLPLWIYPIGTGEQLCGPSNKRFYRAYYHQREASGHRKTYFPGEAYIPNDVVLNREEQQIIMITGPNMSGKSAILRQTALIVLLAQIGSFVPAESSYYWGSRQDLYPGGSQ